MQWIKKIAHIGIYPGMSLQELRLVRLVNIILLIIFAYLILNMALSLQFYHEGGKYYLGLNALHLVLISNTWTFNYFKKYLLAKINYSLWALVFVTIYGFYFGKEGFAGYFLCTLVLMNFLMYSKSEKKALIVITILTSVIYLLTVYYYETYSTGLGSASTAFLKAMRLNHLMGFIGLTLAYGTYNYMVVNQTETALESEKDKSERLLLNILPAESVNELKEKGQVTPKHFDSVTVLFTDFKDFTRKTENLAPGEVIQSLDTCFLAFDKICKQHNLEKIKTIGDGYMCAGGLPVSNITHPFDCVKAGIKMQEWIEKWSEENIKRNEHAWQLRIGIHSGPVIAGVIGQNKFAYDIWGDTVNVASRMESSGEVGKVNISGTTYQLVKDQFHCKYRGKIEARNKGEVDMYFVES